MAIVSEDRSCLFSLCAWQNRGNKNMGWVGLGWVVEDTVTAYEKFQHSTFLPSSKKFKFPFSGNFTRVIQFS